MSLITFKLFAPGFQKQTIPNLILIKNHGQLKFAEMPGVGELMNYTVYKMCIIKTFVIYYLKFFSARP